MIGDILSELRNETGMSQKELGDKLNISGSAISSYERNEREPNDETKIKFAEFFNVSLNYLMGVTRFVEPFREDECENYIRIPDQFPRHRISELHTFMNYIIKEEKDKNK